MAGHRPGVGVEGRGLEDDPWARGGCAYFDAAFDPLWRDWLAQPAGLYRLCQRAPVYDGKAMVPSKAGSAPRKIVAMHREKPGAVK